MRQFTHKSPHADGPCSPKYDHLGQTPPARTKASKATTKINNTQKDPFICNIVIEALTQQPSSAPPSRAAAGSYSVEFCCFLFAFLLFTGSSNLRRTQGQCKHHWILRRQPWLRSNVTAIIMYGYRNTCPKSSVVFAHVILSLN